MLIRLTDNRSLQGQEAHRGHKGRPIKRLILLNP